MDPEAAGADAAEALQDRIEALQGELEQAKAQLLLERRPDV